MVIFLVSHYSLELKRKICSDICLNGAPTMKTAQDFGIPLKTVEKWITAFRKDPHCFDEKAQSVNFKFVDPVIENVSYDDMSTEELKKLLMKKDIEITRLKKGYLVKEGGMEKKVFVIFSKKNMK